MDEHRKRLFGENGDKLIATLILALRNSVTDAACDETCPTMFEYECPECAVCPVGPNGKGELYHNTERDINCWIQYYVEQAQKELGIVVKPARPGSEEGESCQGT